MLTWNVYIVYLIFLGFCKNNIQYTRNLLINSQALDIMVESFYILITKWFENVRNFDKPFIINNVSKFTLDFIHNLQ